MESTNKNNRLDIILPRKLVHSGKKRAYPSSYVWDCLKCGKWNIWNSRKLFGVIKVSCQDCKTEFSLNKSEPLEIITRTKNMISIID